MKNRNIIWMPILAVLACIALLPEAQAVSPAPDGGYPGGNTAEGQNALLSRTTGGTTLRLVGYRLRVSPAVASTPASALGHSR